MTIADLPRLEALPRHSASTVKNKWREVVREVHAAGSVAVTNHSAVEMVLVDAATYEQLTESVAALKAREQSVLGDLSARFDERLAALQKGDAHAKVASVFAARGKLAKKPKAGAGF